MVCIDSTCNRFDINIFDGHISLLKAYVETIKISQVLGFNLIYFLRYVCILSCSPRVFTQPNICCNLEKILFELTSPYRSFAYASVGNVFLSSINYTLLPGLPFTYDATYFFPLSGLCNWFDLSFYELFNKRSSNDKVAHDVSSTILFGIIKSLFPFTRLNILSTRSAYSYKTYRPLNKKYYLLATFFIWLYGIWLWKCLFSILFTLG